MVSNRFSIALLLVPVGLMVACSHAPGFRADVYPIFQKNCRMCHDVGGKGYEASGFSVASYETILKGTKFGPVIVPGSSIDSSLMRLIDHQVDPAIRMPHNMEKLPEDKIDVIRRWIDAGAKDD
jgi:hypothetical protein